MARVGRLEWSKLAIVWVRGEPPVSINLNNCLNIVSGTSQQQSFSNTMGTTLQFSSSLFVAVNHNIQLASTREIWNYALKFMPENWSNLNIDCRIIDSQPVVHAHLENIVVYMYIVPLKAVVYT